MFTARGPTGIAYNSTFSRPGKPVDNSICEAFNGSVRRECLTRHWFASLAEGHTELHV